MKSLNKEIKSEAVTALIEKIKDARKLSHDCWRTYLEKGFSNQRQHAEGQMDAFDAVLNWINEAVGNKNEMLGGIEFLRTLPKHELEAAYRRAKADETDKGQRAACLIGRELIRRTGKRSRP